MLPTLMATPLCIELLRNGKYTHIALHPCIVTVLCHILANTQLCDSGPYHDDVYGIVTMFYCGRIQLLQRG